MGFEFVILHVFASYEAIHIFLAIHKQITSIYS